MKNVIILYGGKSCEHDISIITACLAKGYFADYCVRCVYLDKNNAAYLVPNDFTPAMHVERKLTRRVTFLFGERSLAELKRNRIVARIPVDVVVNCCHGRYGEDGTAAAVCGLLGAPVVGPDVTSGAIAMDKILSKQTLKAFNVPVVDGFEVNGSNVEHLSELAQGYRFPLIVKPNTLGSSIGVAVCRNLEELRRGIDEAFKFDDRILVETALTDFCELNCAAMRARGKVVTSRVDVPTTAHDILTFADKYMSSGETDANKASAPRDVADKVTELTELIYRQLNFSGVVRVDFLYDNVGAKLYVNEINSVPGSLAYGLFSDGYSLTDFGKLLVEQAEADFAEKGKLITAFASSVLKQGFGVKRAKK